MKTNRNSCLVGVLFLTLAYAATAVGQVPAVVVGNPGQTDGHTTDSIGFLFNVGNQPISVSDLGFWDAGSNGLNSAHDVGIFRQSDRAMMVRGTVATGVGSPLDDGFRYVSVPETILEAGELYQAVAYRPAGTTDLIGFNFNQFSPASEITIPHAVFEFGTGELTFATINRPEDGFLGANFKFEAVPEPSTAGDTNADGLVNIDDLNNVRNNFGDAGPADGTLVGDTFPFDGRTNITDLNAVRNNFGAGTNNAVPEPSAIVLAALGLIACMFRRGGRAVL